MRKILMNHPLLRALSKQLFFVLFVACGGEDSAGRTSLDAGKTADSRKSPVWSAVANPDVVFLGEPTLVAITVSVLEGADPQALPRNLVLEPGSGRPAVPLFKVSAEPGRAAAYSARVPIAVGDNSGGMAFDAATGRLYVPNNASNTVSVMDAASNTVVATVATGNFPNYAVSGKRKGLRHPPRCQPGRSH